MRFGPGVVIPYSGAPPQYTLDLTGALWRCPACEVELPAGVIPFPHAADCRLGAGAVLHVIVPDIGDEVLRDLTWDWPPPYDGEARRRARRMIRPLWPWQERLYAAGQLRIKRARV